MPIYSIYTHVIIDCLYEHLSGDNLKAGGLRLCREMSAKVIFTLQITSVIAVCGRSFYFNSLPNERS